MQLETQLGKNGMTEGFMQSLKNAFAKNDYVKISALKTATRDKQELIKIADIICSALGNKYTSKTIGFSIFIKKWRKSVR